MSFFASDALASRVPTPYLMTPTGVQKNPNPSSMQSQVYFMGAGGLVTTAEDYGQPARP